MTGCIQHLYLIIVLKVGLIVNYQLTFTIVIFGLSITRQLAIAQMQAQS